MSKQDYNSYKQQVLEILVEKVGGLANENDEETYIVPAFKCGYSAYECAQQYLEDKF